MSRDTMFTNKFLDNKIPNDLFSKFPLPAPVLRPSVGGGLGVFAFHDVPSRRFAPRFFEIIHARTR